MKGQTLSIPSRQSLLDLVSTIKLQNKNKLQLGHFLQQPIREKQNLSSSNQKQLTNV